LRHPAQSGSAPSPPHAYTPRHLAEKILSSKSALEGEIKQVTVLFADVANYTALAHRLGPEEMHFIMKQLFDLLLDEVHRFEGTVNQFLGDGIMALFGAPIAHEDHAHRALHAALNMQDALQRWSATIEQEKEISITMRIGVNTGPVVVGSIGDDLRMDYTAVGDTTNLAARMQQIAEPGCIFVTDETRLLTEGYFEFHGCGKTEVKGESEPVEVYELTGLGEVRDKIDAARRLGLSKLVGRTQELSLMRSAFQDVQRGNGRVLYVSGEAGIGKSRLVLEFKETLAGEDLELFEWYCRAFGQGIPYHPLRETLGQYCTVTVGDTEEEIREKIGSGCGQMISSHLPGSMSSEEKTEMVSICVRSILSDKIRADLAEHVEPERQRQATFEALEAWLLAEDATKPTVLILEDVQWIDQATEEFLRYLVADVARTPLLLICSSRSTRPPAGLEQSGYTHIALEELPPPDSEELTRFLLGPSRADGAIVESILAKAGGNPLFIEEVVRSIREDEHLVPFSVPNTIQGIISARIDRLDEVLKSVLQAASVIGKEFALRLLERVVPLDADLPGHLQELESREFIRLSAQAPELRYTFKHKLFQEVIYNSLLSKRQQELHHLIGRSMEELYEGQLEEHAELLAHHYLQSHQDPEKALHHLEMAGAKAAGLFSTHDAMAFYEQALQLVRARPATEENLAKEVDLILRIAQVSYYEHVEQNIKNLRRALNISRTLGDEERLGQIYHWLGGNYFLRGDQDKAIACYEQCIALEEKLGNSRMVALSYSALGRSYFFQAKFEQAIQHLRTSADAIQQMGLKEELSYTYGFLGMTHGLRGEWDEAFRYCWEGLAIAEEIDIPNRIGAAHVYLAMVYAQKGEWDEAHASCRHSIEMGEKSGNPHYLVAAYAWLGLAEVKKGELDDAEEHLEYSVTLAAEIGTKSLTGWAHFALARLHLARGDLERAMHYCHESVQEALEMENGWREGEAYCVLAEIYMRQPSPNWKRAERFYTDSIRTLEEVQAQPSLARSHLSFGQAYQVRGDSQKAREHVGKALEMFREFGMPEEMNEAARTLETLG